eukprot:scaffold296095_cov25-Prasinocladus_malaysianus.AAC.1
MGRENVVRHRIFPDAGCTATAVDVMCRLGQPEAALEYLVNNHPTHPVAFCGLLLERSKVTDANMRVESTLFPNILQNRGGGVCINNGDAPFAVNDKCCNRY